MAVKYRLFTSTVQMGKDKGKEKIYARAKSSGRTKLDKLCNLISSRSSVSAADVKSVLDSLNWALDLELKEGRTVQLGEVGNFRLSCSSEGVEDEKDFHVSKIKRARLLFSPGASLRRTVSEAAFEKDDVKIIEKECDQNHPL